MGGCAMKSPSMLGSCIFITCWLLLSCSTSVNITPVVPDPDLASGGCSGNSIGTSGHVFWGFYDVTIDPLSLSADVIPQRVTAGHLNALRFLEVAPCSTCLQINNINSTGPKEYLVDAVIRHPFIGLDQYTGFNVRGVVMFDPSYTFPGSGLTFPNPSDLNSGAVINPDGYTHLFNPVDYPAGSQEWPAWEYQTGKYATLVPPGSLINPYKNFSIDTPRRYFGCTMVDTVTYDIRFPSDGPLHFGYAIDANWAPPLENPPDVPDDFPLEANIPEPYKIDMIVSSNTLWSEEGIGGGGEIRFHLKVFDCQDPRPVSEGGTIDSFRWEIPGMTGWTAIDPVLWTEGSDANGDFVDYEFVEAPVPDEPGSHMCLISVIDSEIGLSSANERAYIITQVSVHQGETCWDPGAMISDIPNPSYQAHLKNAHCTFVDGSGLFHLFYLDIGWKIHHLAYQDTVLYDDIILPDEEGYNINAVHDEYGYTHIVFADKPTIQGGNIIYCKLSAGGELSEPVILSASSQPNQFEPALAAAPNGDILALWMDSHDQTHPRLCAAYFNGTNWTPELTLHDCYLPSGWINVSVVADSTNTFHMTFCEGAEMNLLYRKFQDGVLGSYTALVSGPWRTQGGAMSIDSDDRIYVTFEDNRSGSLQGYSTVRNPGDGTWTEEVDLIGHNYNMNRFQNEPLPDGTIAVVWTDWRDGSRGLYSKVFDPFLSEAEIQDTLDDEIDSGSSGIKNQTRLCVDQYGTLHLVWSDDRSGHWQLFYSRCTP